MLDDIAFEHTQRPAGFQQPSRADSARSPAPHDGAERDLDVKAVPCYKMPQAKPVKSRCHRLLPGCYSPAVAQLMSKGRASAEADGRQ